MICSNLVAMYRFVFLKYVFMGMFIPCFAYEPFILITSLYNEMHPKRMREYLDCLQKNLQHPLIGKIHIIYDVSKNVKKGMPLLQFLEQESKKNPEKVRVTYIKGRPTYDFCFKLANELYPNRRIILSNADIYFNETLSLLNEYDLTGKFLAITRWDVMENGSLIPYKRGSFKAIDSQDVWIFVSPVQIRSGKIALGTGCCDCRIAYEAEAQGYTVINPCLDIQCCHLHHSGVRHYTKSQVNRGLYKHVLWTHLNGESGVNG